MTEADVIAHWRTGALSELQSAKLLQQGKQYAAALFHCHLAVEKALKSNFIQEHRKAAPLTHDLLQIALQLNRTWTDDEKKLFADLTGYAVAARYDDPVWAEREATSSNVAAWIKRIDVLLSSLFQ
ncbi:MAG: HEPN domain-containing protein [Candidatus Peregrinibacteria bacterium]|nr:HEPN domain-containing protein [Candidatus Peregrinibacteria bacterium]